MIEIKYVCSNGKEYNLAGDRIEGTGEVHFIFRSGATATRVVHPDGVNIGSFTVESNKVYEVSILEGLLTSQNWSVS